jgi:hypothetical protein
MTLISLGYIIMAEYFERNEISHKLIRVSFSPPSHFSKRQNILTKRQIINTN